MKEVSLITTEAISTTKEEIAVIIKNNPIQTVERDKDLKVAKEVRKVFRDKRLEIQGQCNEFTKQLNDAKKEIKNIALDLIEEIKPFEDKQDAQIKAFEEERARKKREQQEKELNRIKVINETIAGFKGEVNAKVNSCTIDNISDVRDFISSFDFDAQEKSVELNLFINQSLELLATKEPILRLQKEQAIKEAEARKKEAERIAKEKAIKEAQEKKEAELKAREEAILRKEREALKKIEDRELEAKRIAEEKRQKLEAQRIALEQELLEEEKRVKDEKEKAIAATEAKKRQREETVTIPLSEYNRLLEIEKLYNKLCN